MEPLKDKLVVQELSKEFGANEVLHRISFSVKDGEFLSILGPSGCGKTTITAGGTPPDGSPERQTETSRRYAENEAAFMEAFLLLQRQAAYLLYMDFL